MTPERLLEHRRVGLARQREHRLAVVEHVVPPDLVGAVRQAARVRLVRRREQQLGAVRRAARRRPRCQRRTVSRTPAVVDDHAGHRAAGRVGLEPYDLRASVSSVTLACSSAGRTPMHLGVGLRVHEAREPVAVVAAHAAAVGHVRLVEHDPARRVEGVQPGRGEVVGELLDARLVGHRRERVRGARRRLGRVLAAGAVDLVELLGPRVVGLELVVADRPRRRDRRRRGAARRSRPRAGGRAPRRRAWSRRRRSSGPGAGTASRRRRTTCPARCSARRRRRRQADQFSGSRGSQSPRSSSRMRLPEGARWRASVPPPAPVPMTMTS